jgi:hypothetical protein
MNVMNTLTVKLNRFAAAACAAVITAVSAWAFVHSSASADRDPFQFATVMAANAQVLSAQLQSRNDTPACRGESRSSGRNCVTLADTRGPAAP